MTAQHYHLTVRTRFGDRRLIASARAAELAWRWYDLWAADFARRGELLTVQAVAGTHAGCGRAAAVDEEKEATHGA